MSLLGKILAIFNIFAVIGTLALLGMNYAKRQNWAYAVFRQDLMIHGLPLNQDETDNLQQQIVDKIGTKTQQDLFKQVSPPTPVTTQEAEVDRVKTELENQYKSVGDDKKKQIFALAHILTPMADTIEQRQAMIAYQTHLRDDKSFAGLQKRLKDADAKALQREKDAQPKPYEEAFHASLALPFADPLGPFAEAFLVAKKANQNLTVEQALTQAIDDLHKQLQGRFEQMFANAKNRGEGAKPGASSPQQKRTIARLLFNMVEVTTPAQGAPAALDLASNPAYKRFFIVVGVEAALEAIDEQAGILRDLAFETETERPRERGLFAVEYRKELDLVRDKKADVDQHKALYDVKKRELETHAEALRKRGQDVKRYEEELAAARRDSARHLAQLRELSDVLFAERVKLRDNTQSILKLEHDIRALEQKR
jgi:hypothetical protein